MSAVGAGTLMPIPIATTCCRAASFNFPFNPASFQQSDILSAIRPCKGPYIRSTFQGFIMVSSINSAMPGSFSLEITLPPKLDLNVGAKSNIFQLPTTPSASSSLYISRASISSHTDSATRSRKRSRHESCSSAQPRPCTSTANGWSPKISGPSPNLATPGTTSPASFVNTRYKLAGGLDTPTAFASALEESEDYGSSPDLILRGGRGWDQNVEMSLDDHFPRVLALAKQGNGRPRFNGSPMTRHGWGKAVYSVVGVAGKVWEFCRTTAFRGFYAGGGQGFCMNESGYAPDVGLSTWQHDEKDNVFQTGLRERTPVPGRFPEADFIPDYLSQDHTTPVRAAKKIQREKGDGDLRSSWVMIGSTPVSRESSPTRISARKIPAANNSTRKPLYKAGRRPIHCASRPSLTSFAGSPALRSERPASFASARSPVTTPKHDSPKNVEVQRHAARIRRREMEEDANLKRFNQQLKAMIKEGKEALGTKFEVEEEPDGLVDEGYGEGDYSDEKIQL